MRKKGTRLEGPYNVSRLTKDQENQIRRSLMVGLNGHEFPPEEGCEDQSTGHFPFYDTDKMAENAMLELLKLKAENFKFIAEAAERYHSRIADQVETRRDEALQQAQAEAEEKAA